MKRLLIAFGLGTIVSLGLFYFMSQLISGGQAFKKGADTGPMIDFIRLKQQSVVQEKKREIPKKPDPPKPPPKVKMNVAKMDAPQKQALKMNAPNLDMPLALGDGPFLGGAGAATGNNDVMPLVRIQPPYPRKAAMKRIEGWVKLKFDITPAGTVSNVDVIASKPRRIFDRAARNALLKWKYKPMMVDGKPTTRKGNVVQLDFKLAN